MGDEELNEISQADVFQTFDGINLYEQWWRPQQDPKAGIILIHGLAEHSGRHGHLIQHLLDHSYAVDALDLRGHGKSNGVVGYVRSFDDYLMDVDLFVDRVKGRLPGKPMFMLGLSMGGAIAALFAITRESTLRGIATSAPTVKLAEAAPPILQKLSAFVSRFAPRLPTLRVNCQHVSRDPEVVKAYDTDPLVYRKRALARTGAELVRAGKWLEAEGEKLNLPVLIMHGGADKITDVAGSRLLYEMAKTGDKTLKVYDGLYHEVLNEPEKETVLKDLVDWLDSHVRSDDR